MKQIPECFATTPIVYAVGKNYQIMVPVNAETLMWVEVGGRRYYDDVNGILRSQCTTHRMTLPMEALDRAGEYTVGFRIVNERKPYRSDVGEEMSYTSKFRPVKEGKVNFYHIADAHNRVDEPVAAAAPYKENLDFLVLNGDIPNHSGKIEYFTAIHRIASEITDGEIPVVFSRGNHDMRGIYAENLCAHTPVENGNSFFTFRLGSLWGIILDCGEDKDDSHPEYGFTVACGEFRRRQTEFIKSVIERSDEEYAAKGVTNRVVICHNPFTRQLGDPFSIEADTYSEWATLLKEQVKPQVMICGHVHSCYVDEIGCERDHLGQPCPVVAGSRPEKERWIGAHFSITPDSCNVKFTDSLGQILDDKDILF